VVPYTSGKIWCARLIFLFFFGSVFEISTAINIKILTNSNQQTQSYKFNSHITAFLSVVLITEMLEICIQTLYDQNVQLILKSYLPVGLGTTLSSHFIMKWLCQESEWWRIWVLGVVILPLSTTLSLEFGKVQTASVVFVVIHFRRNC
jgi:hypothetical protein